MLGLLMIAFLVVPIIELYLFVEVSASIGFGAALLWIIGVSVVGAWLVKREGLNALRRANAKVASGEVPTDELITGILILFAGALMLTPGFLTDGFGLLLLFPPTRALFRRRLRHRFAAHGQILVGRFGTGTSSASTWRGDVVDVDSWEDRPRPRRELE